MNHRRLTQWASRHATYNLQRRLPHHHRNFNTRRSHEVRVAQNIDQHDDEVFESLVAEQSHNTGRKASAWGKYGRTWFDFVLYCEQNKYSRVWGGEAKNGLKYDMFDPTVVRRYLIRRFYLNRDRRYTKNPTRARIGLKFSTLRNYFYAIQFGFDFLHPDKNNPTQSDVVQNWFLERQENARRDPRDAPLQSKKFTVMEVEKMTLESMKVLSPKAAMIFRAAFLLGICTGWRFQNLKDLNVEDLLPATLPTFRGNLKTICIRFDPIKTVICSNGMRRRIIAPVENPCLNVVGHLSYMIKKLNLKKGSPLFVGACPYSRLSVSTFNTWLRKVAAAISVEMYEKISSHSMRRTGTTWLAESGASTASIKSFGGWKSGQFNSYIDVDMCAEEGSTDPAILSVMKQAQLLLPLST